MYHGFLDWPIQKIKTCVVEMITKTQKLALVEVMLLREADWFQETAEVLGAYSIVMGGVMEWYGGKKEIVGSSCETKDG